MRIAVHTAWDPERPIAEAEVYQRMARAVARLGWTCCRTNNTRAIEEFAPDVVLAEHFFVAKLTPHPTLGLMWNPPAFWGEHEEHLKNVISYDGHLFADHGTRQFVRDLVSPLATRFVEGRWFPTCQATSLASGPRAGLAYCQAEWDPARHRSLLQHLAQSGRMQRYGPGDRKLPFDGGSVLEALSRHAAALCLHSDEHRRLGTPSARLFEAAAAGAVIISDRNDFVSQTFGDAALYVDSDGQAAHVAADIGRHLTWIENNPAEADRLRRRAHEIFRDRFAFEHLLQQLPQLVAGIRDAWTAAGTLAERSVAYVVRTGARDLSYLDRALLSLQHQTHANLRAIVVAYRNADAVGRHLAARPAGGIEVAFIESADTGMRSTALWSGLNAVSADYFGILDDDDTLFPNHVACCLATLEASPHIDLAYSGSMTVHEDGGDNEPRAVHVFDHFDPDVFRQRNDICSNAWLARRDVLNRVGPDPELAAGEDYYLLLRLLRGANFAPTWRLTAEYRLRTGDRLHSRQEASFARSFERIKRRLHFAANARPSGSGAGDVWSTLARNDFIAGRVLREAIKRRYRRKGLTSYLADVAGLPRRLLRLPAILMAEGIKGVLLRLEQRGAGAYDRRTRQAGLRSGR